MATWGKPSKPFMPFGECYCCGGELSMVNNIAVTTSSLKGGLGDGTVKRVRVVDYAREREGDKSTLSSAMLSCSHCVDGKYYQLYCPECMKKGVLVPLKLICNEKAGAKRAQFCLKCEKYHSSRDRAFIEMEGGTVRDNCDFCINILEKDGRTPTDEIRAMGGLQGMYSNWGNARKRVLKLRESMKSGG